MQSDLRCVRNAVSPNFPGYLINNEHFNLNAAANPKAQLSTGTGVPGFIRIKDLRTLEKEGRSPLKTAAEMHRHQKKPFKGWRIALSRDFPELLSHRRDETGSPIPPERLHLRTINHSSEGISPFETTKKSMQTQ